MFKKSITFAAIVATLPAGLVAKDSDLQTPPPVFQAVLDCKLIVDSTERLACYDRTVESMQTASQQKDLVVADRESVREAKKGLFGLSLPNLKLFGSGKDDEINEIESKVKSFQDIADGKVIFVLEDGARWKQTDGRQQFLKTGDTVIIKKAALGSYMAKINGRPAIRVMRLAN